MAAAIKAGAGLPNLEVELAPGERGAFEIIKDGKLVFSKLTVGRFPKSDAEIIAALRA